MVGGDPSNAIVRMWMTSEEAVSSSGVAWTLLRPSGFASNALRWLPQLRNGDLVRAPFANAPIASIDPHDIAAVAAVTLTTPGHESRSAGRARSIHAGEHRRRVAHDGGGLDEHADVAPAGPRTEQRDPEEPRAAR